MAEAVDLEKLLTVVFAKLLRIVVTPVLLWGCITKVAIEQAIPVRRTELKCDDLMLVTSGRRGG
ncbi:hypothetical protein ABH924_003723 [Arthrobacter sp. GAS37]